MWPAKLQWVGSIRWKWWKDGHESGQLALFMLVHSLARTDASTPISPLHPARPERKDSLLFSHNGSRRAAKALKTKAFAGGYFRKCRVCWERKGKVDKQAFGMPFPMLVTENQENDFSIYSCSNWDLTNEYVMSKEQSHAPVKKLLLSKGPEPPTILRPNNFNCCCSEREARFGGRVQEGEVGVVEMHKIQGKRSAQLGLKTLFQLNHHRALAAPGGSRVAGVMEEGDV